MTTHSALRWTLVPSGLFNTDKLVGTSSLSDGTKCVEDITELTDCNGDLSEFLSGDLAGQMLDMEDFLEFSDLSQFMGMVGAEGEEATDVTANAGVARMLFPVADDPPTEAAIPQASTSDEPPMKMARLSASESIPSSPSPSPADPPIDRRRKNNVAAQVSRRKRKEREANMEQKAVELEAANAKLREKVAQLEQATTEMKQRLIQSLAFGK
ncbi:transcription factor JunD-like [Branchiostoma lanceolatum]|uniref:transcription factor JunD-like n=1 Tax=Branchiostoma lanceolatum TaxID=7740 RepID=UPI0034558DDB